MSLYLKNTTASGKTWNGQLIETMAYHLIDPAQKVSFGAATDVLAAITSGDGVVATANDGTGDILDVNQALALLRNDPPQRDAEGAGINRVKMAPTGWKFQSKWFEIDTSVLNSQYCKMFDGSDFPGITYKLYDVNDVEITVQGTADTDCVKSVFDIEPSFDFELLAGSVRVAGAPDNTKDLRVWIVAVPDVPAASGGEIVFVSGINLRYFNSNEKVYVDGKTPKLLSYNAVYHTNKLRFLIRHTAGLKQKLIFTIDYYRA